MNRHVFMTGAAGFLGNALLQAMLKDENVNFYLLVRSAESEKQLRRKCSWADPNRLKVFRGDITLPQLGLNSGEVQLLARRIDEVWHVAASTHFDDSKKQELELTNVQGTHNTLKLVNLFARLDRYYAISTAYICGTNPRTVTEHGMPLPAEFKNSYERTKYESEKLIRESGLPFVIIRPSIIMGNSLTGDAIGETRMFYGGLLAMYHSALQVCKDEQHFWDCWYQTPSRPFIDLNARAYGHAHTTKNLVTIDDVVNVIIGIRQSLSAVTKTFNVVNKNNLSVGCLLDSMQRALKIDGIQLDPHLSLKDIRAKRNPAELLLHRHSKPWRPYLFYSEPQWETTNVDSLGIKRVDMTSDLVQFLMKAYTEKYLAQPVSGSSKIHKAWGRSTSSDVVYAGDRTGSAA